MKKYITLLLLLLLTTMLSAQQMTITDFELNLHDQTANNEDTKVIDDNGNPCALLKIETLQKGFTIEGGSVGIAKIEEEHKGEIWVFVPANLRRITIKHDQLGVLRDYVFPEKLQPARTYTMRLVS
ncbi:MAG: PEGA domain-containing protein, partial [bacterium]|nr:PEGA domain-containing protein [Candidatus Minthenecus merdequi]